MLGVRMIKAVGKSLKLPMSAVVRLKGGYPNPEMTKMEMFRARHKRNMLLLRGAMIRRRMIKFPFSEDAHVMSLSDLAGHSAFVCLAASYMATDISDLRITAVSGITLSIIFQYYREKPLWIPIRWNFLFLVTNVLLLYLLFKESNDADNLPEEQKLLFTQLFQDVGAMKMEDMLHLMMVANREEYQPGTKLISSGRRRHHVYLVLSGKCAVIARNGDKLGTIGPNQFISEQSFTTWQTKYANAHAKRKKEEEALSALIMVDKVGHPGIVNAEIGGDGNGSGIAGDPTDAHIPIVTNFVAWMFPPTENADKIVSVSNSGGLNDDVLEEDRYMHLKDNAPRSEWLVGKADIVVEEPTVVYSWRFPVLHDMIVKRPSIGVVYERLISSDLNRKMLANSSLAVTRSYKQMLSGALVEGEKVSPKTRKFLEKYRTERGVSEKEHLAMVEGLGWTIAEYERGRKGGEGKEFDNYLDMVKLYLSGDMVTLEQKSELRRFRKANKIDRECHERYLRMSGWTLDEYEQCNKDSYVTPVRPAPVVVKRKTPILDWLGYAFDSLSSPKYFVDSSHYFSSDAMEPAVKPSDGSSSGSTGGAVSSSNVGTTATATAAAAAAAASNELERENVAFLSPSPKSVSFFLDPVPESGSSSASSSAATTASDTALVDTAATSATTHK